VGHCFGVPCRAMLEVIERGDHSADAIPVGKVVNFDRGYDVSPSRNDTVPSISILGKMVGEGTSGRVFPIDIR
jgi:hypothetical protein